MEAVVVTLAILGVMGTSFTEPRRSTKAKRSTATAQPPHTLTPRNSNILPPSMMR